MSQSTAFYNIPPLLSTMESLSKNPCAQEGTTASRTASAWEIKEEFIGQRMKAWLATERSMPLHECLSKFWVMSTDPNVAPEVENGIAVSSEHGYKYISFSDDPGSDPRLRRRSEMLEKWSANPANKRILVEIEGLMVQEIRDKLWWLRQDEHDDPLKMGVLEKVGFAHFYFCQLLNVFYFRRSTLISLFD